MAIKGISDIRRLPRLGCIRLGIKVKHANGSTYPKEVDYFILDPDTPDDIEKQEYIMQFTDLFGEKPKTIEIMFPVDDIEIFFPQFYKRYGSSTDLKCRGDNETALCMEKEFTKGLKVIKKTEHGKFIVECKGDGCIYVKKKKPECGMVGSLLVLIPKISMSGVWQITTRSFNSIVNLNSSIALARAGGRIHMVPAKLQRRPQQTKHDGKKSTHYILHLNIDNLQSPQIEPGKDRLALPEADASVEAVAVRGEDNEPVVDKKTGEVPMTEKEVKETFGTQSVYSENFYECMMEIQAELKKATKSDALWKSELSAFVASLTDVKDDPVKQTEIRAYFEDLVKQQTKTKVKA